MEGQNNPAYGADPSVQMKMQPPGQPVIMAQPGQHPQQPGANWMARPQGFAGCPPGLEYLMQVDQLIIKQQKDIVEMFTGWEQRNKYRMLNSVGQQVFFAQEESECFERQCCGPMRGFTMHITDNMGQEVIRINREFKCCAGCCWCADGDGCAMTVTVEAPVGQQVGLIRQQGSKWKPHYTIRTPMDHQVVGRIRGPCCICSGPCCDDVDFKITNDQEDADIGKISKQWSGWQEFFTDADTFSVTFPMDMDVRTKAAFIGATFLIDFMYFEKQNNN